MSVSTERQGGTRASITWPTRFCSKRTALSKTFLVRTKWRGHFHTYLDYTIEVSGDGFESGS